jgi:penicillin-binding protein 1C
VIFNLQKFYYENIYNFKLKIKQYLLAIIKNKKNYKIFLFSFIVLFLLIAYWYSLPRELFNDPCSTIIYSKEDELLGAKISDDGQWRFPYTANVPDKFEKALLTYEDHYFYLHPGINPLSICRALYVNLKYKKIISGGSTITMQLIRISRKGKPRNIWQKIIESVLATRAELRYSKKEILSLFASNAPFGGNIVGLEAASWRYFGRRPENLSWAEAATLAVLPNSPSLIHPGRNREILLNKRNRLLQKLYSYKIIDSITLKLSLTEKLPPEPLNIPQIAPHLLMRIYKSGYKNKRIKTTIDINLQERLNNIIENHANKLKANQIFNAAAIVADVENGNVLAYVGNTKSSKNEDHGNDVDIITSSRSPGSIMKPLLYAAMLDEGMILPGSLIPDVPIKFGNYSPKNFTNSYDGAVNAQRALSRSLNVPAVIMLRDYDVARFYDLLKKAGIKTLNKPSAHYGLSLILGGAEVRLWDIAGIYCSMARILKHFDIYKGHYLKNDIKQLNFLNQENNKSKNIYYQQNSLFSAASIWFTFKALLEVNKPEQENGWEYFLSTKLIAWKTGTSFGFKDGWAVGITPEYVAMVWVGNADGEGRSGLTGIECAAPILFDIFRELPKTSWFFPPFQEMTEALVCKQSGYLAGQYCSDPDTLMIPKSGLKTRICPYHKLIHLDKTGKYRVSSECETTYNMKHKVWFVLPPLQEYFYKFHDPSYKVLPQYRPDCLTNREGQIMEFIYPTNITSIYIPVDLSGKKGNVIFQVAHTNSEKTIFWHLDGFYIGSTKYIHQLSFSPSLGKHKIVIVDEDGNMIEKKFTIIN